MDWSFYPNFQPYEFRCSHTGLDGMQADFMMRLQYFRSAWGRPMRITSGYRHPTHPLEARKAAPGEHTEGLCADIAVSVVDRWEFVELAFKHKFPRIGVAETFIHLGIATRGRPSPRIWTY